MDRKTVSELIQVMADSAGMPEEGNQIIAEMRGLSDNAFKAFAAELCEYLRGLLQTKEA
ncbi:MAG: hypothetical protein LUF34_09185 [Lachnospiraceae bacterium]|nr:hypothetical protein [Lachnospiraceae bacterium]